MRWGGGGGGGGMTMYVVVDCGIQKIVLNCICLNWLSMIVTVHVSNSLHFRSKLNSRDAVPYCFLKQDTLNYFFTLTKNFLSSL